MVMRLLLAWLAIAGAAWSEGDTRLMLLHDHVNPVVSEMVRLTIRGEYDLTVSLEDMEFPNSPDYDWMQIARDDWHKERVNGRLLQIFERKIALFPRHDGPIEIGPINHRLTYVRNDGSRGETMVAAPPTRLEVKPFPAETPPLVASQLVLKDELSGDPGQLRKDEILTRRVTIEALGMLAHQLPPRPDLSEPWLISFTQPERRETILTDKGPLARVVWEWQLRPITGEPAILHSVAFPWLDTNARQIEIAAMKPIPFGFAGFGANFGERDPLGWPQRALLAATFCISALAALLVTLHGRGLEFSMLSRRLRRWRPDLSLRAMRQAAAAHDLPALRAAADAYLRRREQSTSAIMSELDRQLYAAKPLPSFNPRLWLARLRRSS